LRLACAPTAARKSWGFGSNRTKAPNSAPGSSPGVKNRGVGDVLIAVVDGLKGFPEAITAVFPQAMVQTPDQVRGRLCIVHLLRHSLDFVSWKDRKAVAAALKDILPGDRRRSRTSRTRRLRREPLGPPPGAANTRLLPRAGGAPGAQSSRSMPSPPRCAGFCIRPMPSSRSIPSCAGSKLRRVQAAPGPSCAGRSEPGAISPATRRQQSSSSWS
jgi:hypothetical protein